MAVIRLVPNIAAEQLERAAEFYTGILDMQPVMDIGWIQTFAVDSSASLPGNPQISFATEGGSGTPVPDLSIEVDNFEEVYQRVLDKGFAVEYGPVDEAWGVRRFYTRDPFNRLINILAHT